jgi:hypothetical protein
MSAAMRNQFLFASLVVVAGCGTDVDSTVSGVFPAEGFTGRSLRVEISGDATEWSGTPGVNFGDGVTVSNVTVASPTSLFADISIAADAAPGLHDVTVTNDGTFTLKQAFDLQSPLELSFQGDVAQGGIPYFTINNHDFDTPFDLTTDANDAYANLLVNAPSGVTFSIQSATSYQLTGYAFIDADAMPGAFSVVSGPTMKTTAFNLGANLDVMARSPEALSGSMTGTLANIGDSKLYSVSIPASPSLVRISTGSSNQNAAPVAALLPNGHWDEALNAGLAIVDTAGTVPVTGFDNGTAAGYNFSISSKAEALATAAEASDTTNANGSTAGATVASAIPFMQTGGTLSSESDNDMIKFTLTTAATIHVSAHSSDDFTDTVIDIKNANGTTSAIGGPQDTDPDIGCGFFGACGEEFVTTTTLAAGTYYLDVSAGPNFDSSAADYTALIYIE